eukprot:GHVU01139059.1.p1 GENE.GHVU01139059.1~~GHVU01139059.1.p1  ORF type:complete len:128 (+),score=8.80 GHVU01139059.1:140-523(+)
MEVIAATRKFLRPQASLIQSLAHALPPSLSHSTTRSRTPSLPPSVADSLTHSRALTGVAAFAAFPATHLIVIMMTISMDTWISAAAAVVAAHLSLSLSLFSFASLSVSPTVGRRMELRRSRIGAASH